MKSADNTTLHSSAASTLSFAEPPSQGKPIPTSPTDSTATTTLSAILGMTKTQWLVFLATYLAWALDMFDVSLVPLSIPLISKEFNVPASSVAIAITCMMVTRSLGCLFWGWASDIYGRKRPLLAVIFCFSIFSFSTGLTSDLTSFVIVRSIFGFAMGGEWGLGTALCMETIPTETRGFFSGALQSGTYLGFLLASMTFRFVSANPTAYSWHTLFYFSMIPSFLIFLLCLCVPESPVWLETQRRRKEEHDTGSTSEPATKTTPSKHLLKQYLNSFWILRVTYLIFMIASMSFVFHSLYDLYPTILMFQHGISASETSILMILQSVTALIGGPIIGFLGQAFLSRKTTMFLCYILLTAFLYPYFMNVDQNGVGMRVSAALVHFFIAGGSSPIPAHLAELSPPELRGTVPGLAFNLGQTISAPLPQVIALIAESLPKVKNPNTDTDVPNYALVSFIITLISILATVLMIHFGPENKGGNLFETQDSKNPTTLSLDPEYSLPEISMDPLHMDEKGTFSTGIRHEFLTDERKKTSHVEESCFIEHRRSSNPIELIPRASGQDHRHQVVSPLPSAPPPRLPEKDVSSRVDDDITITDA